MIYIAVEGVVASLKAGRNCAALGSTTMKLFAQRKVMSMQDYGRVQARTCKGVKMNGVKKITGP